MIVGETRDGAHPHWSDGQPMLCGDECETITGSGWKAARLISIDAVWVKVQRPPVVQGGAPVRRSFRPEQVRRVEP